VAAIANQALARRSRRTTFALGAALLASGCDLTHTPILDPKGPIALAERNLLLTAIVLMLVVIIPVFVMAILFAWRYRASNTQARYTPDWSYSARVDAVIWLVPALIVIALGVLLWGNTHRLDPYRRIDAGTQGVEIPALEVQVVAQDWKWLFIYPEQNIAAVNLLVFPAGQPLSLKITSDTVMNSFFIPALGGQIYAMAGMRTQLHLKADAPGKFAGRNTQYSGSGFADQHFQAFAASAEDFDAWLATVKDAPGKLDTEAYRALAMPRRAHPISYYSAVEPGLFDAIIEKYTRGKTKPGQAHADHAATNDPNARPHDAR
jgi:cytochrome o ubiquinol oxidase subunit 2